jgi:hypothetical protein
LITDLLLPDRSDFRFGILRDAEVEIKSLIKRQPSVIVGFKDMVGQIFIGVSKWDICDVQSCIERGIEL